jgi:hypothetical protein
MPITKAEIEGIVSSFVKRIVAVVERQALERAQSAVSAAFEGAAISPKPGLSGRWPLPVVEPAANGRKLNLSPKAIAARKLQGKYLGIIRGLPAVARERVRKVAHEKGVAAAIEFAVTLNK